MQDSYGSLMDATASEWLDPDMKPVPFWDIIRALSDRNVQYDCVMMPDGIQRFDKDGAAYIHILNYRYEEAADRVKPVDEIELILRDAGDDVTVLTLYGAATAGTATSSIIGERFFV